MTGGICMEEDILGRRKSEQWILFLDPYLIHNSCFPQDFVLEKLENNIDNEKRLVFCKALKMGTVS